MVNAAVIVIRVAVLTVYQCQVGTGYTASQSGKAQSECYLEFHSLPTLLLYKWWQMSVVE